MIDMAEDSQLPALISQTSLDVGSFNEWKTDDLIGWLQRATVTLVAAEKWTDQHRLNVGAALYALRERLKEGDYGKAVGELATSLKITTRTLANWRRLYEEARQLPPPGPAVARTEAQRQRQLRNSVHKSEEQQEKAGVIEARAEEIPNAHLSGLEPDEPTGEAPPAPAPAPPALSSAKDENKAVEDSIRSLLPLEPSVLSRVAKRSELADLEGLAKRAQQADPDNDGSRVVLLAADLVARFLALPSEPFDAGVNRAIRDLLAEVERLRQPAPVQPASASPAATKAKPAAATKKAPKPTTVKRPKKGEPCTHPREAHVGVDMRGVTCSWCDAKALTHVSLERMGQAAVAAR